MKILYPIYFKAITNALSIDHMHNYFLVLDKPAKSFPVNSTVLLNITWVNLLNCSRTHCYD